MINERNIKNSQYAVNVDIVTVEELETLLPEMGALVMSTAGKLYVGDGFSWVQITLS